MLVAFFLNIHQISSAKLTIYQSNPLSLLSKERVKLEYNFNSKNSILASGALYWGLSPGYQAFAEYRHYTRPRRSSEFFYYIKGGQGHCNYTSGFYDRRDKGDAFSYILAGGGVGWHLYPFKSKVVFFDLAIGAKTCRSTSSSFDPYVSFFNAGPGSVIDANFHIGIRLWRRSNRNDSTSKL